MKATLYRAVSHELADCHCVLHQLKSKRLIFLKEEDPGCTYLASYLHHLNLTSFNPPTTGQQVFGSTGRSDRRAPFCDEDQCFGLCIDYQLHTIPWLSKSKQRAAEYDSGVYSVLATHEYLLSDLDVILSYTWVLKFYLQGP